MGLKQVMQPRPFSIGLMTHVLHAEVSLSWCLVIPFDFGRFSRCGTVPTIAPRWPRAVPPFSQEAHSGLDRRTCGFLQER